MTKERKQGPPDKPAPLAATSGPPVFSPVTDLYVSKLPVVLKEVKADYPPEARRLGLDGRVSLRIGLDRTGKIRFVKVLRPAGHGFDEAAVKALWQFRFSPAVSNDGQAVDYLLTYHYTFRSDN
jgi:TonB family protein